MFSSEKFLSEEMGEFSAMQSDYMPQPKYVYQSEDDKTSDGEVFQLPITRLCPAHLQRPTGSSAYGQQDSTRCTWMLKNLPSRVYREELQQCIHQIGFKGLYDFFYLPMKPAGNQNRGYAFIGFPDAEVGYMFKNAMSGYRFAYRRSSKVIEVCDARLQSLEEISEHFTGKMVAAAQHGPCIMHTVS